MPYPPYTFADKGNFLVKPPAGVTVPGAQLDANFAAAAAAINDTNYPEGSTGAKALAAIANANGSMSADGATINMNDAQIAAFLAYLRVSQLTPPGYQSWAPDYVFNPALVPVNTRPTNVIYSGSGTAFVDSAGLFNIDSDYTDTTKIIMLPSKFAEGRLTFDVVLNKFILGYHIISSISGWYIWSSDGANLEIGYINVGGGINSSIGSVAMPGSPGDLLTVELAIGDTADGSGALLYVWLASAQRPASPQLVVTFGPDGAGSVNNYNEGFVQLASFSGTTAKYGRILIESGQDRQHSLYSNAAFVGRWFPRYEGAQLVLGTIRQGSSFCSLSYGNTKFTAWFAAAPNTSLAPYLAVYVNGVFQQFVVVTATGNLDLLTNLDPTVISKIEVFLSGLYEHDPVWAEGAGLLIGRIYQYDGVVVPWVQDAPKGLFIGDSITEGILARGTPSEPSTGGGDIVYGVLTARALGATPVLNGFGGTGLVHDGGSGGVPVTSINAENYMNYRPIETVDETVRFVVINIGTNDALNSVSNADFQAAYLSFVHGALKQYPNARIYLMLPFGPNGSGGYYPTQIQAVCTATGAVYVDTTGWLTAPNFTDTIHLNVGGHHQAASFLTSFIAADRLANSWWGMNPS